MTEFERGVREGVNNALAYFRGANVGTDGRITSGKADVL